MLSIKMSSKRQATFPRQVCDSMGIGAGDTLMLDRRVDAGGEEIWVIRSGRKPARPWAGGLKAYADGKEHDMESVRESIAFGRQRASNG